MPQSFVSNNIHIVFSTKERKPLIPADQQKRLWAYMGGIAKNVGVTPLSIGGMPDHVHVLAALPADLAIAKFVNVLKSNSSNQMDARARRGIRLAEGLRRVFGEQLKPGFGHGIHREPGRASQEEGFRAGILGVIEETSRPVRPEIRFRLGVAPFGGLLFFPRIPSPYGLG
jgi:REP element-mobilizing transposase RayT